MRTSSPGNGLTGVGVTGRDGCDLEVTGGIEPELRDGSDRASRVFASCSCTGIGP